MTPNLHIFVGTVGLAASLSILASTALAGQSIIDQKGLKFLPNTLTINAGDTVLFTNSDPFTHNVTVIGPDGKQSDKGQQHHGQNLTVSFPEKGTFPIVCSYHPNMKATVVVK